MFTYSCNIAHYQVIAQLYGQHVLGSPLALPVATSSLPGLLQLGLVPHDNGDCKSAESNLLVGSECVAKWMEDKVWYRARVDKVEGKFLEVTFLDYGNKESVAKCDVVKTAMDIPKGEDIDEFVIDVESGAPEVDTKQCVGLDIGDVIIAKWAEDNVWYNGEITKFNEDEGKTAEVYFTDYGNTADVEMSNIVKTMKDIPMQEEVDENVLKTESWSKGCVCIAKWPEDDVWYNAMVVSNLSNGECEVIFTDYGNTAIVAWDKIVAAASKVPAHEVEFIDQFVKVELPLCNMEMTRSEAGVSGNSEMVDGCMGVRPEFDTVVSSSRIVEAQNYLDWSVQRERENGLKGTSENVWSRYQMMEEKFLVHQLKDLLGRMEDIDQTLSGKVQNVLANFKRSLLVFSRNIISKKGRETVVVVGTGGMYCTRHGGSELASIVKLARGAAFEWITKFVEKCSEMSVETVVKEWKKNNGQEKSGRDFIEDMLLRTDDLFVEFESGGIPEQAQQCFLDAAGEDAWGSPIFVWLRLKKKGRAGMQKEELWRQKREKGQKLMKIVKEIRSTCLLEDDLVVSRLSVYDEISWPEDMEVVMAKLWNSLGVWPFISYDGEGNGIWAQIGFYSPVGWECLVFGPGFFPVEVMEVLESPKSIILGKNIHKDLMWILGSSVGWRAIDLGVWTRDCPYHGHGENGLKKMFERTLGIKKLDFKKNPELREKFGYIRSGLF